MDTKKRAMSVAKGIQSKYGRISDTLTWNDMWPDIMEAIEEAKREERFRCKEIVAKYMFEGAELTFQDNNFDFYETTKDMGKDLVEGIESEAME